MKSVTFEDGLAIHGSFPDDDVLTLIFGTAGPLPLVIADPPYGNILSVEWDRINDDDRVFANWMLDWTTKLAPLCHEGAAAYIWGGIGRPSFRPFYRYLANVEHDTPWTLANHVTWKKKRAYGVQHNYLFTREELAYLTLGDPKRPRRFTVPLLAEKRGYAGYNAQYPAKSEYYHRTSVWTDVTEILRGKRHVAEKPSRLAEIPIEVHTTPGEWVLDPFAGSGSTADAARKLGRRWIMVERDADEFERLVANLRRAVAA